jgi:predicted nucleic acid-binding protein
VVRRLGDGSLAAQTSSEVVQEVLYVLSRKGRHAEAIRLARCILDLFPDLLSVTQVDMALACDILEANPALPCRDAVHAATMRRAGLDSIVSVDQHFDQIEWLRRIDPASETPGPP